MPSRIKSGQCSDQFTEETILNNVYNCLELSHAELDLVILANIQAFTVIEVAGEKRKKKSTLQLSSSVSAHLQGDVSKPLWNQQIAVSAACRTLPKLWYFSAYTWEQQETTA